MKTDLITRTRDDEASDALEDDDALAEEDLSEDENAPEGGTPGKNWVAPLAVVIVALLVAGIITLRGRQAEAAKSSTMNGSVTLGSFAWSYNTKAVTGHVPGSYTTDPGTATLPAGTACWGNDGYDDIQEGAEVLVKNEVGATIATGRLAMGSVDETRKVEMKRSNYSTYPPSDVRGTCTLAFTTEDVPKAKFYKIEIGRRSGPTYSYSQMKGDGWTPTLSLG